MLDEKIQTEDYMEGKKRFTVQQEEIEKNKPQSKSNRN